MKTISIVVWILGLVGFSWGATISYVLRTGSIQHLFFLSIFASGMFTALLAISILEEGYES